MQEYSLTELTALFTKHINEMGFDLKLDVHRLLEITEIFCEEYKKDLSPWYIYEYFGLSNQNREAAQYEATTNEKLILMLVIADVYKEDFKSYKGT